MDHVPSNFTNVRSKEEQEGKGITILKRFLLLSNCITVSFKVSVDNKKIVHLSTFRFNFEQSQIWKNCDTLRSVKLTR